MSDPTPTQTPNVVVSNPHVRKVANVVLGAALIVVPLAIVVDGASPALDWSTVTVPAMAGVSFLAGLFGLVVTVPNVPSR